MNPKRIEQARDPLLRTAIYALRRAAKRVRLGAERTGTCLVIRRGKGWVRIFPSRPTDPATAAKLVRQGGGVD